ncbi:MAG TPA: SemiSWEET transporter [Parafilimonas sp.]|nr:SemiSWEET transporter [Parafilimonas sp.]
MPGTQFNGNDIILFTGIAAGVLTAASMLPQVFKTLKTKKAEHVSPLMLVILICGVALWLVYGILKNDMPIMLTNGFSIIVNLLMLFLRWRYKEN